jgi:hypothetical protein
MRGYPKRSTLYIQKDATLHSLFYLVTALHVSGGTITHHQERKQLYLQHLVLVTSLLLSAAIVRHPQHTQTSSNSSTIAADSSNGVCVSFLSSLTSGAFFLGGQTTTPFVF